MSLGICSSAPRCHIQCTERPLRSGFVGISDAFGTQRVFPQLRKVTTITERVVSPHRSKYLDNRIGVSVSGHNSKGNINDEEQLRGFNKCEHPEACVGGEDAAMTDIIPINSIVSTNSGEVQTV